MPALANGLRRDLERTIITARDVAEVGARAALEALTVHEGKPGSHLSTQQRELRNRLRAHGRQLGDGRNEKSKSQAIDHLTQECAYEHWHRMIFARFLAENDLLVEPESGVSVTLEEVEELARDQGVDHWELASRFAQRMLPQIFRPDDPVLAVPLPTETRLELESLLESLPAAVFTADDSLGWVYQFWQSKKKDEVNASGEKITGDTLPAVTQLFTEHYMVLFLLHNTVGAWHAGKVLAQRPELAETASSEQELRDAVALSADDGYSFEYLRFVKVEEASSLLHEEKSLLHEEKSQDGSSTVDAASCRVDSKRQDAASTLWRPAAGTFDGWPKTAAELKVLDPCCGSGHFLVAVFELLTRLRMDEEGLSAEDAARAVLRDNIFGLEIDPRCTQIAAFALAFAAWKISGWKPLPPLNIACSGIGPSATLEEWLELAEGVEHNLPRHAREPVRNGLENLHRLFSQAPELGSLLDPTELPSDMFAADYETLQPFLEEVFKQESADVEARERAVAAQGMAKAADLLSGSGFQPLGRAARQNAASTGYTLVITNVPYLGRGKQGDVLKSHLEKHYATGKADLATAMVLRCLEFCKVQAASSRLDQSTRQDAASTFGTIALVTPQNWLFLTSYKKLRESLLKERTWNLVARLGPGAFETIGGHVVNVALVALSPTRPGESATMAGIDVSAPRGQRPIHASEKAALLRGEKVEAASSRLPDQPQRTERTRQDAASTIVLVPQAEQLKNPDSVVQFSTGKKLPLLGRFADTWQGLVTCDDNRFLRCFWEVHSVDQRWKHSQQPPQQPSPYTGKSVVILWEDGNGRLHRDSNAHNFPPATALSRDGVAVQRMSDMNTTLMNGEVFGDHVAPIIPNDHTLLDPIWCYAESGKLAQDVRRIDTQVKIAVGSLLKVPFDLAHWQQVAAEKYPNGLPEPESDDPTQWLFHGYPGGKVEAASSRLGAGKTRQDAASTLQVAVARLLGYRWPAELEVDTASSRVGEKRQDAASTMRLSARARELVRRCNELLLLADPDGIVCLPAVRSEGTAAERLRRMLAAAYGDEWSAGKEAALLAAADCEGRSLDEWLRTKFFEQHCKQFHHRPFIWHIWDGRKDGFHALVNYHKLCTVDAASSRVQNKRQDAASTLGASGRKLLETLTYSYLGDWITRQRHGVKQEEPGAEARLAAAKSLQEELKTILEGEPPYDIFVRWKPLHEQPIGWEPDINDGVRLNIRPFLLAKDVGRKGAGILRFKPNVKWKKDRGKEPQRDKDDFPWFWGDVDAASSRVDYDGKSQNGSSTFTGNRWNDLHYTNEFKQAARERAGHDVATATERRSQ